MILSQLAVQLYTLRDFLHTAEDIKITAKKVRAIGYSAVEIAGFGPLSPAEFREILDGEGLAIAGIHASTEAILETPEKVVEDLDILGVTHASYPYPAGIDFTSQASIEKLAAQLDASGAILHQSGKTLAYHNHANEFLRHGAGTVLDFIYASCRSEHLQAELDTYWVQYGGANPVAWIEKLAGRLPLLHLKDYAFQSSNQPIMAEVGAGNLDFPAIISAARKSGVKWYIVEQDVTPGDPFDSIKQSFDFIQANLLD